MSSFLQDLRYEARFLRLNPGFSLAVILTLALSIGANSAVFTVVSSLLLRQLPYSNPSQLVLLDVQQKSDGASNGFSLNRYELLRDHNRSFSGVAVATSDSMNLTGHGEPGQVAVERVSPNFFALVGVRPQLGRDFIDEEGRTQGRNVVLISSNLWRTRFGSDPSLVNQTIDLDGVPSVVVGVLPSNAQFPFLAPADVWTPRYFELTLLPTERLRMGVGYLSMVARLRPSASLQSARSEMEVLNQQYTADNPKAPDAGPNIGVVVQNVRDATVANIRTALWLLMGAVAVVLLIACSNVASLLLSRALARRREIAIRSALGAQRASVVRQLLTQSLLLSSSAGILGLALAFGATQVFASLDSTRLPNGMPITVDWRVLSFTIAISLLTGVIFGLVPALQLSRINVSSALRDESRGSTGGRAHVRLKSALVVGQIALSLMLLIGAGLLLRSFQHLLNVDTGFDPHNLLTMNVSLPTSHYAKPEQQSAFFDELLRKVEAVPGVQSVAISTALPFTPKRITPMLPEGQPEVPLAQRPFMIVEAVSPDWFSAMRVPLRGRAFTAADLRGAPSVIIVNQALAKRYWPNQEPIGKHIAVGRLAPSEVVGVAGDVRNSGIAKDAQPQIYMPFVQLPWADANLLVRTATEPHSLESSIRQQVTSVDPEQPVTAVQTADELMNGARTQPRFMMLLLGAFSLTALALAVVGIYGVLAYSVAQRRQEVGIRLALGANRSLILKMIIRQGLILTAIGIAIGLALSAALTRTIATFLYRVGSLDLVTFLSVSIAFLAIALLASYLPARRASTITPLEILR
jgi:putative ABC transport system permease protein